MNGRNTQIQSTLTWQKTSLVLSLAFNKRCLEKFWSLGHVTHNTCPAKYFFILSLWHSDVVFLKVRTLLLVLLLDGRIRHPWKDMKWANGHMAWPHSGAHLENVFHGLSAETMDCGSGSSSLTFGLVRNVGCFLWSSAPLRVRKRLLPRLGCEYCRWVHRLPYPDIVSKNISSERQAYARASVWRSCRLCSLLSPSRCWSERLNDPSSPARVLICHCLCCFAACERDPRCRAFRDQPVLMESVTCCWCLLLLLCSVPATLFLPFREAESMGQRLHLAHFNSVVTAVAVTPFGKSQGANRTVGHLSSYLAPFPFPSLHMVRIFFFFSVLTDRVWWVVVCVCWGVGHEPPSLPVLYLDGDLLSPDFYHLSSFPELARFFILFLQLSGVFCLSVISKFLSFCSHLPGYKGVTWLLK